MSDSYERLSQQVVDTSYHSNNTNPATSTSNATILSPSTNNLRISSISYPHRHRSGARSVSPGPTIPLNAQPYTNNNATMVPPPPPPGAPVPLNAPGRSTFRPVG